MVMLGQAPADLRVLLAAGAAFSVALRRQDGSDWGDVEIALQLGTTTWTATNTADRAEWAVPAAQVDALLAAGAPGEARLWYSSGSTRVLWAYGPVEVVA